MLPPLGSPTPGNSFIRDSRKSSTRKFRMKEKNVALMKKTRSNGRMCFGTYTPAPKSHPSPRMLTHTSMASRSQVGRIRIYEGRAMAMGIYGFSATAPLPLAVKDSFISPSLISPNFRLPFLDKPNSSAFATMTSAQRPVYHPYE